MNYICLALFLFFITPSVHSTETLKETLFKEAKTGHRSFSYTEARKKIFNDLYLKQDSNGFYVRGVYCQNRHYSFGGQHPNGRIPDHTKINTEHTWPQSKFSSRFKKSTQKTDLHHLFPTYSRINSDRGNLPFADVNSIRDLSCDESHAGQPIREGRGTHFEPAHKHKGNVARAMFYFSIRYKISIDSTQEYYLRLWHHEDPVDVMEKNRHEKIYKLQGNRNPFIDHPILVNQILDF